MQTPTPPKGTRDFYPEEMALREYVFNTWEKTCKRYGFEKVDAPIFEHLELFTKKSGDEIEKQLYTFEDKSGRKLALRPEITPSLARMVAQKGSALKKPVRWYSIPRLFRYEKMQKGRLREFFQLNVDILGITQVNADAELIAVAIDSMRDLGLDNSDFSVHVSSRNLLEELFTNLKIDKNTIPPLFSLLDKQHKLSEDDFFKELEDFLVNPTLAEKVHTILQAKSLDEIRTINTSSEAIKELDSLFELISNYGMSDFVKFDIGIVRGLAYYTGIVFELLDKKRSLRSIAGGGRYDRLVDLYGGPGTPATGFATGDVVLAELLKAKNVLPGPLPRSNVFIVSFDKDVPGKAIRIAQMLRNNDISCEFALKPAGIGKQMKLADAARAKIALLIGGDEEKENKVKIRNMETGSEELIPFDAIIKTLKRMVLI
jgi:histidyl-tRNA synthetase